MWQISVTTTQLNFGPCCPLGAVSHGPCAMSATARNGKQIYTVSPKSHYIAAWERRRLQPAFSRYSCPQQDSAKESGGRLFPHPGLPRDVPPPLGRVPSPSPRRRSRGSPGPPRRAGGSRRWPRRPSLTPSPRRRRRGALQAPLLFKWAKLEKRRRRRRREILFGQSLWTILWLVSPDQYLSVPAGRAARPNSPTSPGI